MAGRLTTTSSTIMEDREALKREAARERQKRGAMSGVLAGNGTQNRPSRTSALQPHANPTLFGAPVRVEQEDATSLMIKNVLGDYQTLTKPCPDSAAPISHGPSSHFASLPPAQHPPPAPQPSRRPQQAGAAPVEARPTPRQPNGVSSPLRGLHPQQNPKQAAISQAPNHSKPPVMTAAARKSHMAEPVASTKPSSQDLLTRKSSGPPSNKVAPKPASNNNNSNSNNNNVGGNRVASTTELSRIEEVLKEMKVPPLLPNFDDADRREAKRRDEQRNNAATSLTTSSFRPASPQAADVVTNDMPTFSNTMGIGSLPALPIEPPPVALSPMSSPQRTTDASTSVPPPSTAAAAAAAASTNAAASQNQRLHGQALAVPPQQAASMSAPGASSATGNANKKAFDVRQPQVPAMSLSSSSSESDDDDDRESASQEDSQDSDVEQKPIRMNASFDKSFAATEKFPDKSNQFGDGGVPSLFPQQRVPQLQVQPPNSTEGHSIESPLSASDDTNAEESKASSWSLANFISRATPNSVASSVKSPMKSSPRRSPTPSCDATPSKAARDNRSRKRGPSGSDHSKESSIEPTSSAEKRKPAPVGRQTRSSVTPDSELPSVPKNPAVRKLNNSRVSPLAQNHHEGTNGVDGGNEPKRRKAVPNDDDSSLVVRIPLNVLKRRPLQGSKCDNSSNQVGGNSLVPHNNDTKQRLDRFDSTAPAKLNSEESRDPKEIVSSKANTAEDRRADSPMSIESISSSSSSRRRHHSPDSQSVQEKTKRVKAELQSSRKRVSEKRDRGKSEVDASARRDKEASSSRKDEKRKTTSEEKRVREDRKPLAGPSSASTGGIPEPPTRTKDDRREIKQEIKEEVQKGEREPFALYKHHLATNHFEWGMTLSDAAERAAREQKRTKYDTFIEEAKALKHGGDSETTNVTKAKKYLQSATCFLLGGNMMELARPESSTAYKMYQDTLMLVKHAFSQGLQKAPPGGSQECRLAVLCLKVQAFLCYRVYCAFNRDKDFKDRLLSSHQEFMRLPVKQTNEQLTPNGTTVSPAGSQSSASSGVPNNRDNGLRQDVAANSQPKQITLTVDLVSNLHKYHYRHSFLTRAVELWAQAENLTVESNNTAFFQAVESGSANTWMMMPSTNFALYVREAIYRIEKFNGVL